MNNNRISQKQGITMVAMNVIGTSIIIVMGMEAKMDIWISILLAGGASVLLMLIYARLTSVLPEKDFFEILTFFFGKVGSKIVILIFTLFCFQLSSLVVREFAQFIVTVGFPETPLIVAMAIVILLSVYAIKTGLESIGRWSSMFILFVIPFIFLSVLLVSNNMNISNLLPVLDNGLGPVAKGALSVISLPFGETVVFLLVFSAFHVNVSAKKVFVKGLIIGGLVILIISSANVLVLGTDIAESTYYPTFETMTTIHYGDFLQRFDVLAAIVFVFTAFLKLTFVLFAVSRGVSKLIGLKDNRFIVIPIAFLTVNYALFSIDSMIYYQEWTTKLWPYYSPVFTVVLPLILWIIIEIKVRKNKKINARS